MKLASARANVLAALKVAKIIDQDGKTLERAKQWRDDEQYAKVCEEIRSDIYPRELLDAIPDPLANRQAAERWFANHTGAGTAAVGKMVSFYSLLSQADPAKAQERSKPAKATKPDSRENARAKAPRNAVSNGQAMGGTVQNAQQERQKSETPELHINLQIHISSDSSADQAELSEGRGSRVRIALHGVRAVFHRPHPQKETDKGAVVSMRRFLTEAGVEP